jgi:MFS transporter, FHS family, glucose/mannose:H+ symporter
LAHINEKASLRDYLKEIPNYLTVFIVPIYFLTISPMLLEMSAGTGISTGDLSLIITFFTIGIILGQLTSMLFNRKFNRLTIITAGYILIILLLLSLSFVSGKVIFFMLYLLLGYVAGVIWIQSTGYILENRIRNKERLTTIFLSFYPLGSMTAPFIGSLLISNGLSWRYYYYIAAAAALVIMLLFLVLKRGKGHITTGEEENIPLRKIFFNRNLNIIFIIGCFILFFYCFSEVIMAVWTPTFLRTVKSFDIQYAGLAVSIFWFAVLIGRLIVSVFAGKIKTNHILLSLSIIAIAAMIIFIPLDSVTASLIAVGFAGLGHSAIITLGVASAGTVYIMGRGILASIVFAAINSGTSLAPFITRYVSRAGMTLSVAMAPVFMGFALIFIILKMVYERKVLARGGKIADS